jgi:Ankyrin repeat
MVFYDWLQRPPSAPTDTTTSNDVNKSNIISRTKGITASAGEERHQVDIPEEASAKQLDEHDDNKRVHDGADHAFPCLHHRSATDISNDDTATLTADEQEEENDDCDVGIKFLRAWEEHEKRMLAEQHHEQHKISDNNDDILETAIDDDDDDVEPLRKIPFLSLDLKLDETEHSDDDEEEGPVVLLEQQEFVLHTGAATASCYSFEPDCTANQEKQQDQAEPSSLPTPEEQDNVDDEDERVPFFSLDLRLGLDETETSEEEDEEDINAENDTSTFILHTGAPSLEPLWNNETLLCQDYDEEEDDTDENDEASVDLEDILDPSEGDGERHHLLFPGLVSSSISISPILDVLSSSTKTRISTCASSSPAVQELIARASLSSSSSSPMPLSPSSFSLPPLLRSHNGHDTAEPDATRSSEDYQRQEQEQQKHYESSSALLLPSAPLSPVSRKSSSQHGPELSGPAPPITHRTPIPTWISFSLCSNTSNTRSDSTLCLSSIQDGKEEDDENVDTTTNQEAGMHQSQQEQAVSSPPHNEILDPTDPLICGKITSSDYLQSVSTQMEQFLLAATDDDIDTLCHAAIAWMQQHPMVCQVKYRPPEFHGGGHCYPLSYFSAAGWLDGCQAAYNAFPEAIGQDDNSTGLPLHYACLHQAGYNVISFLVDKHPEATRITNNHQHETPLHLYCRSIFGGENDDVKHDSDDDHSSSNGDQLRVIELLLRHYPTAAQLADLDGFTPLHLACQRGRYARILPVLQALQASSPTVIRAATRSWHKPAHIAALHGASYPVMEWLLQTDPTVAPTTAEDFSTVLHCAVQGQCGASVIRMIRDAHLKALTWTNANDETPYHVGERMGASSEILDLLAVPNNSNDNDGGSN